MKSHPTARKHSTLTSHQTAAQLMEAMPAIMQSIRVEMRSQRGSSLTVPQFRVLAYLHRHPHVSLSAVADHIGVTRATASAMVERLVQRSFVDRQIAPAERRQVLLTLTQMGRERLEEMQDCTRHQIATLLDELPPEDLEQVSAGLTILGQVFDKLIHKLP